MPALICFGPIFIALGQNENHNMIGMIGGVMTSIGLALLYKMTLSNEKDIKLQKELKTKRNEDQSNKTL